MADKSYYAVVNGRVPGIYDNWEEVFQQIRDFPDFVFNKFPTYEEAKFYFDFSTQGKFKEEEYSTEEFSEEEFKKEEELSVGEELELYINAVSIYEVGGIGVVITKNMEMKYVDFNIIYEHPVKLERAMLIALFYGLKLFYQVYPGLDVKIYYNSTHCIKIIRNFMSKWEKNGWKTFSGKEISNSDVLIKINDLIREKFIGCKLTFHDNSGEKESGKAYFLRRITKELAIRGAIRGKNYMDNKIEKNILKILQN